MTDPGPMNPFLANSIVKRLVTLSNSLAYYIMMVYTMMVETIWCVIQSIWQDLLEHLP